MVRVRVDVFVSLSEIRPACRCDAGGGGAGGGSKMTGRPAAECSKAAYLFWT